MASTITASTLTTTVTESIFLNGTQQGGTSIKTFGSINEISKRYLSEDYTFCRMWQKIGGDIWLDPNIKLNHVGQYVFSGNTKALFK